MTASNFLPRKGKKMNTQLHSRKGFTLIELLVVIAIIAILAAIMFPVLQRARQSAYKANCMSNLKQLSLAYSMYVQDHDEKLPHWWQYGNSGKSWNEIYGVNRPDNYQYQFWPEYFWPYLKNAAILREPALPLHWKDQYISDRSEIPLADYSMFTWGPGGSGTKENPYWRWAGPPASHAAIARPAETVSMADGYLSSIVTGYYFTRHFGGANCIMHDGHVQWIPGRAVFTRIDQQGNFYFYHFATMDR